MTVAARRAAAGYGPISDGMVNQSPWVTGVTALPSG